MSQTAQEAIDEAVKKLYPYRVWKNGQAQVDLMRMPDDLVDLVGLLHGAGLLPNVTSVITTMMKKAGEGS